ncbi:MAG: hypothetical protein HY698_09655 [Deltaproteobacteria bacterium]|nr:hypothetical protein [Deltaproteobacteria bacterium]
MNNHLMTTGNQSWHVLAFTLDDVVTASQDSRLAQECVRAWRAAGKDCTIEVLQGPGDGQYLFFWFVSQSFAGVLDDQGVDWRKFIVGGCDEPPAGARDAIALDCVSES